MKNEISNVWHTILYIPSWWFQICFIFIPNFWGRWTHFDEHIFQRGGWNQQLVTRRSYVTFPGWRLPETVGMTVITWKLMILCTSTYFICESLVMSATPTFRSRFSSEALMPWSRHFKLFIKERQLQNGWHEFSQMIFSCIRNILPMFGWFFLW